MLQTIPMWAVLVAGISAFVLGGGWYAVLDKPWRAANGFGDAPPATNMGKVFGISFVLTLLMAFNLAKFLDAPNTSASWGATAGFLAGFGWCFMGIAIVALFERRGWKYILINGGYLTVALTLMGLILGACHRG
jgi:hypothetical protein